jgi:ketosteroid isomerase-like protein
MSNETVELTLLITDAFNRRDVDAVIALWDDEGVWYPAIEALTEGRRAYHGPAGWRQYFRDLAEFAEEGHIDWSEGYDLGDQVLVLGQPRAPFLPTSPTPEWRRGRSGDRQRH